jgi:DNA-binding response OmpR family regulator
MSKNKIIKVMVVDNDNSVLDIYRQGLTAKGYSIKTFVNPVQAREYLLQTTEVPDVILIDVMMSNIEGLTLIHEIHSAGKTFNVPIIAVSTIKDATMLTDVFIFGATDYVVKPFDINVLDMKIKHAIETIKKEPLK